MTINQLAAQATFYWDMYTATDKPFYLDRYNETMAQIEEEQLPWDAPNDLVESQPEWDI